MKFSVLFTVSFAGLAAAALCVGCHAPRAAGAAPVPSELQAAATAFERMRGESIATREEALRHAENSGLDAAEALADYRPFDAAAAEALAEALPSFRDSLLHARLRLLLDHRFASRAVASRDSLWKALVALRFAPRRESPPVENGTFRKADLVELIDLDSTFRLDIRYAGTNNFAGMRVYDTARAFLQRPAAEALVRVSASLRARGMGLIIYDGYRPWRVTRIFWEVTPDHKRQFVADPDRGSRHNRGCAVDLGLYDLATGVPLEMPSDYDDFSERAYPTYAGGSEQSRAHRDLLIAAMNAEGFETYPTEWWHFDFGDWREYRILDVPFGDLDP